MNIEEFMIDENSTILEAMERLDRVAQKVLFLVKENKLEAALTDGDIRRWILKKGALEAPVKNAANYSPKYIIDGSKREALRLMKELCIEALPILNKDGEIQSVVAWNEKEFNMPKQKIYLPVVMMAGGLGKRLYPYTSILPKPLIPVGELTIAEHIINQFLPYGCDKVHMIVNHKKNMIKAYFNEIERDYSISYADEDKPLGTGGGLSLLKGKVDSTFILTNCDILITEDFSKIYKLHKEQGNVITMICSVKNFAIPYGVVDIGKDGEIEAMREKPQLSFFTNTGCYFVEPEVIDGLEADTPIGFPDIIEKCKSQGKKVGVYPISEQSWMDMGQLDELDKMQKTLSKNGL